MCIASGSYFQEKEVRILWFSGGAMIQRILALFLGCIHTTLSRPFGRYTHGLYVVCLDCGRKFKYNWEKMEVER